MSEAKRKPSPAERLRLIQTLNALPSTQFEELICALNPPPGNIPGSTAPQGIRSAELFKWLESPIGPGLAELEAILADMTGSAQAQTLELPQSQQLKAEAVRSIIQTLSQNQAPKYDLRGAQFSGGFAETGQSNQVSPPKNGLIKLISENLLKIFVGIAVAGTMPWWADKIPFTGPSQNKTVEPSAFIYQYYEKINNNEIEEAWTMLTPGFQSESSDTFEGYLSWWNKVDSVLVNKITLLEEDSETARVKVEVVYLIDNKYAPEEPMELKLVWNKDKEEWQIDGRSK